VPFSIEGRAGGGKAQAPQGHAADRSESRGPFLYGRRLHGILGNKLKVEAYLNRAAMLMPKNVRVVDGAQDAALEITLRACHPERSEGPGRKDGA
jgi:hypothetical protein